MWKYRTVGLKLCAPDDGTGNGDGGDGGGGGSGDAAAAEKAAADKAAADKIAADKATAEKAAADKIAAEKAAAGDSGKTTDEEAKLLKEIMAKKQAIKDLEEKLGAGDTETEKLKTELQKYKDAEEKAELLRMEEAKDFEGVKKRMADKHAEEMQEAISTATKPLNEQIKDLTDSTDKHEANLSELLLSSKFASSNYITEETVLPPAIARATYESYFDVKGTKVVAFDKPKGEEGRTELVDGQGKALSFDAALTEIIKSDPDYKKIARAKIKPGADSSSQNPGGSPDGGGASGDGESGLSRIERALANSK